MLYQFALQLLQKNVTTMMNRSRKYKILIILQTDTQVQTNAYCTYSHRHTLCCKHNSYTLIVLKMLKPLRAVVISTPGSCGCQWSSFISFCPWWIKRSWGGIPSGVSLSVAESFSTAKSHWTTCVWGGRGEVMNKMDRTYTSACRVSSAWESHC